MSHELDPVKFAALRRRGLEARADRRAGNTGIALGWTEPSGNNRLVPSPGGGAPRRRPLPDAGLPQIDHDHG